MTQARAKGIDVKRLEDILVDDGLITPEALRRAREAAGRERRSLIRTLTDGGYIDEAALLGVAARRQGLRFVSLEETAPEAAAIRFVPAKLAAHYGVLPLALDGRTLTLATSDPLELAAVEDVETNLGCHVDRVLACRADIQQALNRSYGVGAETVERILAEGPERASVESGEVSHDLERQAEDASVIRLVNQLLQDAIADRATDIHFEAYRDGIAIRRRIDGVLYDMSIPRDSRTLYPAMVSRVKLMSHLDIVERRLPQDGRARVRIGRDEYDLRVSVVPAVHGEDVVIRILPAVMLFDLGELGFSERHRAMLEEAIARPYGICFVTGPTGSGKSTTLYACLSRLNSRERKIITIEDPVEYELRGITQTQVNPRIGLTFARALPSMLRHDPDVMMIGEVRDRETADIAVQTAMTGHLVLSTLHTNDAAGAAVRLLDMGIDPYLIASTVHMFIAQRLVRVLCPHCRQRDGQAADAPYRAAGCRRCKQTGFSGRMAIAEFLPLVPEIRRLILARASAMDIREAADRLEMETLRDDGIEKVAAGLTTEAEVRRVTSA